MTDENWHRRTWTLAAPVIVTNVSTPLLGAVDTAVVGHLPGPQYLGAVAVGALIFTLVYHGCNFLRMGTTGLTAQSFGARDGDQVRAWLTRAILLAGAIGLAIIVAQGPILWLALKLVGPSGDVASLAEGYFDIRIWGAPAALANFAILGWFFGVQDMRAALLSQVYMNGVNIVLDLWFVMGLGWGVEGVAWATLISEASAVGVGLVLARRILRGIPGEVRTERVLDLARFRRMLGVNGDIFIRSMCLQGAFVAVTAVGARMGDTVLAANAVLLNFFTFMAYALDGFANAAEAMVGEALGAGNRVRFRAAVKATGLWALGFSTVFSLFFLLAGGLLIDLLTGVAEVRLAAREYLPWAIVMPLIGVWSFQFDGVYIGATWSRQMRDGMALSLLIFLGLIPVLAPPFANHGLWAAFTVFMVARAVTLMAWYPRLEARIGVG